MKYLFFLFFPVLCLISKENKFSWAENTLAKMSLNEKIGQLFIAPVSPLRDESHLNDVLNLIEKYHLGGVIVKKSDPITQMQIIAFLQDKTKIPLFVAQDAENGLGMRMDNAFSFPKNLTLGAICNDRYLYLLGKEIGRQMRLIGSHINFAPVVDVNTNPANPVIHMRSFGDDIEKVSKKAIQYMKGLQEEKILACAKHFPGHGDTVCDSHFDLPIIAHNMMRLKNVELYPFKQMIENKIACVMTAHLQIPSIVGDKLMPSSLSSNVIENILRKELNFDGLIITDALNMKGLTLYFSVEDIAYMAYVSGNDILLYGDHISEYVDRILQNDVPTAIDALIKAFEDKKLKEKDLDKKILRILKAKEKLFMHKKQKASSFNEILKQLHCEKVIKLKKKLFELAITDVNKKNSFPLDTNKKIAYLSIGNTNKDFFYETLSRNVDLFPIKIEDFDSFQEKDFDYIVISFYQINPFSDNFGMDTRLLKKLEKLNEEKTAFVLFGTPYAVSFFEKEHALIVAYEDDPDAQIAAANVLLGNIKAKGRLPVSINRKMAFSSF